MSVVAETIAYLKASAMPPFKAVEGAAEFKALTGLDTKTQPGAGAALRASPAAFVIPLADAGMPSSEGGTAFIQRINPVVGIVIGLRELSDAKGGAAAETVQDLAATLRTALLGWIPASAMFPFEFQRGTLQGFVKGTTWWLEEYRCGVQIRKT